MPVSKKRKGKKGKPVKRGTDRLSSLTLQDLINVVAYQEAHPEEARVQVRVDDLIEDEHTVLAEDAVVNIPTDLPVMAENGDGTKRRVGTASVIPGDDNSLSIRIDDPNFTPAFTGEQCTPNFSIEPKENEDGGN